MHGHDALDLRDPAWKPWSERSLQFIVDMQGTSVGDVVKKHPYWEALEFRLHAEQHKISGFRQYLGNKYFNAPVRLTFHCCMIPCLAIVGFALFHIKVVSSDPFIYTCKYQLIPHLCTALGFGMVINWIAFYCHRASLVRRFLNACLYALERQVNKDWALIMNASVLEDPASHLTNQELLKDIRLRSISELWQITTCEESLRAIANSIAEDITENRGRRFHYQIKNIMT